MTDFSVPYPWTVATVFGTIRYGNKDDEWRPLWKSKEMVGPVNPHTFPVPIPEYNL